MVNVFTTKHYFLLKRCYCFTNISKSLAKTMYVIFSRELNIIDLGCVCVSGKVRTLNGLPIYLSIMILRSTCIFDKSIFVHYMSI